MEFSLCFWALLTVKYGRFFTLVLFGHVPRYNVEVTPEVLATYSSKQEAILDTGCSKSVASEEWTSSYISSLNLEDQRKVVKKVSENRLRFGDNQVYTSQCYIIAPVWIGGRRRIADLCC